MEFGWRMYEAWSGSSRGEKWRKWPAYSGQLCPEGQSKLSSALIMESAGSSKTLVHPTRLWHYIPEESIFIVHCH
jgi:hypothetical protein